ncbi:hypothetical protein DID88_006364 [Monilinia fructigena]|uniref:Uncharacterized protein n=1 Tax=Monilinia fructigena TaxID=38457 RepID=A0A395J2H4_9HELO|nr:hypothetical protein DID88_006364 [Monilinia fructigena]
MGSGSSVFPSTSFKPTPTKSIIRSSINGYLKYIRYVCFSQNLKIFLSLLRLSNASIYHHHPSDSTQTSIPWS